MRKIFILALPFFILVPRISADTVWKNISSPLPSRNCSSVAVDRRNPAIIYAGATNGGYRSADGGKSWKRVFTALGDRKDVRYILIEKDRVLLCTKKGLFVSKDENSTVFRPSSGAASKAQVFSAAVIGGDAPVTFIATKSGVYKSNEETGWTRVFFKQDAEDVSESDSGETEGMEEAADGEAMPKVRALAASFRSRTRIYFGTDDGIYVSDDAAETFSRFPDDGLPDKKMLFIAESPAEPNNLYAVTHAGIFYYEDGAGWRRFEASGALSCPVSVAFDPDPDNSVWVVARGGIFKGVEPANDEEKAEIETENIFNHFDYEPTIEELRKEAIRYAEVHPAKISDWRRRAGMKALLPRVNFGIDESKSDNYEIYTSASSRYIVEGPTKSSDGWDLTLSWDLGELIWSNDQTLIDVRSKLMVQLRDDILNEVNSYYFERRRLQIELLESPPKDRRDRIQKELRIQELTANLDGLTGGYFSRNIKDDGV